MQRITAMYCEYLTSDAELTRLPKGGYFFDNNEHEAEMARMI